MDDGAYEMRCCADAARTQKQHRLYFPYYNAFCNDYSLGLTDVSAKRICRFIQYLRNRKTWKGKEIGDSVAKACVQAVTAYWANKGWSFQRKNHPQIAKQLKGYRRLKPSKKRVRKPFSIHHLQFALDWLLKKVSLQKLTLAAALCIGYFFGGRVGESTCNKKTLALGAVMLLWEHLDFVYDEDEKIKSLIINFQKSKVNQFGEKVEIVEARCTCGKNSDPCAPHIVAKLLRMRYKMNVKVAPTGPVLW